MAIPPILTSLIPILARRDDLLEIARNVYVAPSGPDAPPAPSSGLLADLSPGEAQGPNWAARFVPDAVGPVPITDRREGEPAPAPSLIGLRAPRIAATAPMPEAAEPRIQDAKAPAPRSSVVLPVSSRAAAFDPPPNPVETPLDPTRNAGGKAPKGPVLAAPTDTSDGTDARQPGGMPRGALLTGALPKGALPNPPPPATPIPAANPAPTAIAAGIAGDAETAIAATSPGSAHARREIVESVRNTNARPVSDNTALAPGRRLSNPSVGSEAGRIVDGPVSSRDRVENGTGAGERASSHPGAGGSTAGRAPATASVSDPPPGPGPAAFEGWQMERAGIIASCILNAAMIPGWPPPRAFAVPKAEELLVRLGQIGAVPTEADILAVLKRNGRPPARLARLRQMLAKLTKSRRLRTFLGLAALMATIEAVLEAVETELGLLARSGEDSDEPGAGEERRRHLRL